MKEIKGNLWDYHNEGHWICITTNGATRIDGRAVMGRGCAREARDKFEDFDKALGFLLQTGGNHVHVFPGHRIFTFPVKHHWSEKADLNLITKSCVELMDHIHSETMKDAFRDKNVILPKPGCGNGGLSWESVKPILAEELDDSVSIISF